MTYRIAPSLLSADFARLGDEVRAVVEAGADWIEVDNIRGMADAGADTFVAGSAIFGQPNHRDVIAAMRRALA